ncbi:MAG: arcadin 1 [archaeon GB-1867-005]|nr:arcadin 1 [Candidatus Culexmicrobium cathedralense]
MEIKFKALVAGKSIVRDVQGGKLIKIELVEERELPPPVFYSSKDSEIAREVLPIVKQVIQAMPFKPPSSLTVPRLTLWLTEDEWDALDPKPEVGEQVTVIVTGSTIKVSRSEAGSFSDEVE